MIGWNIYDYERSDLLAAEKAARTRTKHATEYAGVDVEEVLARLDDSPPLTDSGPTLARVNDAGARILLDLGADETLVSGMERNGMLLQALEGGVWGVYGIGGAA